MIQKNIADIQLPLKLYSPSFTCLKEGARKGQPNHIVRLKSGFPSLFKNSRALRNSSAFSGLKQSESPHTSRAISGHFFKVRQSDNGLKLRKPFL